jgi:hypothetical protein
MTALPPRSRHVFFLADVVVGGVALLALLAAEVSLMTNVRGTHFAGGDGKMAYAVVHAAFKSAAFFDVNNISHVQGIGSQLLPLNVWANPAYWPFAMIGSDLAADVSGVIALACFATAVYAMARCFDMSPVPSALAAQMCLVLFGPLVVIAHFTTVFSLAPGFAVVYTPLMLALGVLARIEDPGLAKFAALTGSLFLLVLLAVYLDPLWSLVGGISWAAAFAAVAFASWHPKTILLRGVALGCCGLALLGSGVLEYSYTLPQYTARAQFSAVITRPANVIYGSVLFTSEYAKYFYAVIIVGLSLGIIVSRGRTRALVVAGTVTFAFLVAYVAAFLLTQPDWWLPVPIYVEQCVWPLLTASAVAGFWGAGLQLVLLVRKIIGRNLPASSDHSNEAGAHPRTWHGAVAALVVVSIIPAVAIKIGLERNDLRTTWVLPWSEEPELVDHLSKHIGARLHEPFRGSAAFWPPDYFDVMSMSNLWRNGIPTANEYSQLVTPPILFLNAELFKMDVRTELNRFMPWIGSGGTFETFFRTLQALGVRYLIGHSRFPQADQQLLPAKKFPRRQPRGPYNALQVEDWEVYEFPHPNVGDYSPTRVAVAESAPKIIAHLAAAEFDFRRDVVLSSPVPQLSPARDVRFEVKRGGFHFAGKSDGTSLVVLPQQFFNCLRASDSRVRIVRANLTSAALLFSGEVDTDIRFELGLFSPRCRRADLEDLRHLGIWRVGAGTSTKPFKVDWSDAKQRLDSAVNALQ